MENITLGDISSVILFLVAFIGGITVLMGYVTKYITRVLKKEFEHNNEATKCLLRSNITSKYYVYTELNEIPIYERENINYMNEQYKAMGGNSYVSQIVDEINNLPLKK